jgi:SAM-dependent methyltransferase
MLTTNSVSYAEPQKVASLDDCWFYHVIDLPKIGTVNHHGSWDLRGRFDEYIGGVNVSGKTFLDVGCATGFLGFEAENRGAIVTSFDIAPGVNTHHSLNTDVVAKAKLNEQMRRGYWFAHKNLNSRARVIYGDAIRLSEQVLPSDIVMLGQILTHLRDPLEAVKQASLVAKETVIVCEGSFESPAPFARFTGGEFRDTNSWWHLSDALYREFFDLLGFEVVSATKGMYRCNHPAVAGDAELWTFVAKRK